MKPRYRLVAALGAAAVAAALTVATTGCGDTIVTGPDIDITIDGQKVSPSPGQGPGASGSIGSVKVVQFGEQCPAGKVPSGVDRQVRIGCTKFVTCTPFLTSGDKAPPAVHGPAPDFFGQVSGGAVVKVKHTDEPFNLDVEGVAPGVATLQCTAKGVPSGPWDITVVP
jgi:hypothetical protein